MYIYVYTHTQYAYIYRTTCLVSIPHGWYIHTPVNTCIHTLHPVPGLCSLCQPELIASTLDEKYRFGVPFKVLGKRVRL